MGKWFSQAKEIERLRQENARLIALVDTLNARLGTGTAVNVYGVSDAEREVAKAGKPVEAMKLYRERTGADLIIAKKAIDSVS
ncbi:MAG: 50S ribosomal protein L7/L12 [Actinomycetaceae bacterium]|nr:50S ribosomal protein L7/L12 [Actinomycetaceae bacterium]MDU0969438.1 50S ribosomal protein L7/L12 [Actinomycetaceae bacterium]